MKATLQERFIESQGKPLSIGANLVRQMDRIPIKHGVVQCTILSPLDGKQGIALKAPKGKVLLSDKSATQTLHIWNEIGCPSVVEHAVNSPTGEIRVWNIYRIQHESGLITEDRWTSNAGMVVTEVGNNRRHYSCSDGIGDFDSSDFEFEIEWKNK